MILVRYTLIIQKDIAKKIATNALRFVLTVQLKDLVLKKNKGQELPWRQ